MSKPLEITKEIWDGTVKVAKLVVAVCGYPMLAITFLNNCGAHIDSVKDPSRYNYNRC